MKVSSIIIAIFLVVFFSGCCLTPPSCDPETGNLSYGPSISYRASSYWGEDAKNQDFKHLGSVGFGVFTYWKFCEDLQQMGLLSGLYFNQFGTKYTYSGDGYIETNKERLSYITLPITYSYEVIDGLRLEAGPDVSVLLSAKQKFEYNGMKDINDIKDEINNFQFGFNFGASYLHEKTGLSGFIRYNGGFSKVPDGDYTGKLYNGGISGGIRYNINELFH